MRFVAAKTDTSLCNYGYKSIFFLMYVIITKLKCTFWRCNLNRPLELEFFFALIYFPVTKDKVHKAP